MTYCFRCPLCDIRLEAPSRKAICTNGHEPQFMLRDWKAEGVMIDKGAFHGGGIRHKLLTDSGNKIDPY
jgi:hypothetical protein